MVAVETDLGEMEVEEGLHTESFKFSTTVFKSV
jgi:hypothetical protein